MSECVVRMEMPKHCYHCDLRYECDAFYAPGKRKPFDKGCRIVCQLPEGHGRLVDADALLAKWKKDCTYEKCLTDCFDCQFPVAIEELENAPTIVPAESET